MMALVARGMGWTITRALAIIQNPEIASAVSVQPLPPPELSRPLYLVTRSDESQRLIDRVAAVSEQIFKREIAPALNSIAPWLVSD